MNQIFNLMNVNFTRKFCWEDILKCCSAEHINNIYLHKMLLEYLYCYKYGLKWYLNMDLRIFLNIRNLELERTISSCQRNRLFVNFCWDGFIWGDVSFLQFVSYRSFKPPLIQSSLCNEKTEISYNLKWIYMPRTALTEALCWLQTLHNYWDAPSHGTVRGHRRSHVF